MGENVVVNVEFEGTNLGTINEIQVVPSDIAWEDLELMLKVYAGHEEEEQLLVKYRDDDYDEVTISTQEELAEAFKVAKRSNNTLQLRVICDPAPDSGTQDGNLVVKANIMTQSVSMATAQTDTNPSEVTMETSENAPEAPDVVPKLAPSAPDLPNEDGAVVVMETEEKKDEQQAAELVTEVTATACAAQEASREAPLVPKRPFYIKHPHAEYVLDINGENPRPGNTVIAWPRKPGPPSQNANQLWYREPSTNTIRSVLNDLCLDLTNHGAIMTPHQPGASSQQWTVVDKEIHHQTTASWSIVTSGVQPGTNVCVVDYGTAPSDRWQVLYIGQPKKKVCTNKETGEQCATAAKGCRAKATKRGTSDCYVTIAKDINKKIRNPATSRSTGSPKRGKKDHYADLAREIGKDPLFKTPTVKVTPKKDSPPPWFSSYMEQFKREVTENMSKQISRRTVHDVLRGLSNAVIETVRVGDGELQPRSTPPRSTDPEVFEKNAYCHDGVLCDNCEKMIVGARYKCGNCTDFDLCEECEQIDGTHDSEHVFVKIRRPSSTIGRNQNGQMLPLLTANIYSGNNETSGYDKTEKLKRKEEKLLQQYQKYEEKMRRKEEKLRHKEEKLKRRMEAGRETPLKKEKLDLAPEESSICIDLEFLKDESFPDGTRVQPGSRLVKKWLVKNSGTMSWDDTFQLTLMWGNMSAVRSEVEVEALKPEEEGILSVEIVAPTQPGEYQSHWRLSHLGRRYGHRVWCKIRVDPKEILEPVNKDPPLLVKHEKEEATPTFHAMEVKAASEPPTPAPRDNEDAPSQLHHILSYETLAIDDNCRAKASQTATPNNTPRNVTPPKSPILEHRGLSNSSSVEVVSVDKDGDITDEDMMPRMTELVQERMASLGLNTKERIGSLGNLDLEDWSSCDEELSDDTDSDFYVVPIPDCFNPELPPASSASTSIYVKKDECRTLDEILTTSQSLDSQPLLKPSVSEITEGTSAITLEDVPPVTTTLEPDTAAASSGCDIPSPDPADYEALGGRDGEDDDDVIVVRVELPGDAAASGVETVPKVVQVDGEQAANDDEVDGAVGGVMEDTDQNANLPLDINDNSAGTPNQENEDSPEDPREMSPITGELASHVVSAARGVTSYATMVAQNAFATAKDVFQTLQANDKYTPPASDWQPKQEPWTPAPTTWTPPDTTWTPPTQDVPSPKATGLMDQLVEMGFADRVRNQRLLDKYNHDLDKVINSLVNDEDNDWPSGRH